MVNRKTRFDPHLRLRSVVLLITVCALGPTLTAQELVTDRPDQTESAVTVPAGSWQLETGWTFTHDEEGKTRQKTFEAPGTLVRVGLSRRWELRVGWAGLASDEITTPKGTAETDGVQDGELGAKYHLWSESNSRPEAALLFGLSVPFGNRDFSSDRFDPAIRLAFAHSLGQELALGYNLGVEWSSDQEGLDNIVAQSRFIYTLALGRSLSDRLSAFIESFGSFGGSVGGPPEHSFDGGFTWLLNPAAQLDFSGGVGISDAAPDWFIGAGISLRYPK
jgi:hypothetical protein